MFPGTILMGAQSRLLPPSVPFRFFASAAVFQTVFWVLVGLSSDQLIDFAGGPGLALAAIHALTLGVLTMTAMGAALQLLPVATGTSPDHSRWGAMVWWLFLPGLILLLIGFASAIQTLMVAGAVLSLLGISLFVVVTARLIMRVKGLRLPLTFAGMALFCMVTVLALGLTLIFDFSEGLLWDHSAVGLAHMILAGYGFMGLLSLGFGSILVPMFALSPAPDAKMGYLSLATALLAVLGGTVGALLNSSVIMAVAAMIGVIAAGAHIISMLACLKKGMRKSLGLSFVMIKAGWAGLVFSLVCGALVALDLLGDAGLYLFAVALLLAWLLTFVMGILQRIIPFLAGMNMSKAGRPAPRLSAMANGKMLTVHAACHGLAVIGTFAAMAFAWPHLLMASAVVGGIGSIGFLTFTFQVARSFLVYHRNPASPDGKA